MDTPELDAMRAKVAEAKGTMASAGELIRSLAQRLRDMAEEHTTLEDLKAALVTEADSLDQGENELAAAVAANPLP